MCKTTVCNPPYSVSSYNSENTWSSLREYGPGYYGYNRQSKANFWC